jgi:uncharacterized protein (TIGR02996 family)
MNDEAGFLRAIQENPEDNSARLAYADWLEERGDTRGQYLLLEHRLSQIPFHLAQLREQLDPVWLASVSKQYHAMFSDEFRNRLKIGKYSKWAVDLSEAHMEALLWMVGEYGVRAWIILDLLERHKGEVFDEVMFARAKLALEMMERVVYGKRMDLDELTRSVRERLDDVRSRRRNSEQLGSAEQGAAPDPGGS